MGEHEEWLSQLFKRLEVWKPDVILVEKSVNRCAKCMGCVPRTLASVPHYPVHPFVSAAPGIVLEGRARSCTRELEYGQSPCLTEPGEVDKCSPFPRTTDSG